MSWRDSRERRDEVKAAFLEGMRRNEWEAGRALVDPEAAWLASEARHRLSLPLEPPPPIPPTIPIPETPAIGEAAARAIAPED